MDGEIVRLSNVLNDFLDIQRIEAVEHTYHFTNIEVGNLVRESTDVFAFNSKTHTFPTEIAKGLPTAWADSTIPVKVGIFRNFGGFAEIEACKGMYHRRGEFQERAR